jgi:hypothetical protein
MDETMQAKTELETTDHNALIMMLAYVEAECRRLGAEAAAKHAAMAAALVPAIALGERMDGASLH